MIQTGFFVCCSNSIFMSEDWTREEVEIIVAEYFGMLTKELSGIHYNKSEVRRRILPLLKDRSAGSVEFKNRNISAVLVRMGQPYIQGYFLHLIIRNYYLKMLCFLTSAKT